LVNKEPVFETVGIHDEDDLCCIVFVQEFLCDGNILGGLIMRVVDVAGVRSFGARGGIERAFHEH